jgi:hypothetical protein
MRVTNDGVVVSDLIAAVKAAIKQANVSAMDAERDLRVAAVQLVLNTVATRGAGGGVDFKVPFIGMPLKAGSKVGRQRTHTIDVTLTPGKLARFEIRDVDVQEALVEAIATIRGVIAAAADGDDPFELKAGSVELAFAITREGSVSFGVDGEMTDEITQTLCLELERV